MSAAYLLAFDRPGLTNAWNPNDPATIQTHRAFVEAITQGTGHALPGDGGIYLAMFFSPESALESAQRLLATFPHGRIAIHQDLSEHASHQVMSTLRVIPGGLIFISDAFKAALPKWHRHRFTYRISTPSLSGFSDKSNGGSSIADEFQQALGEFVTHLQRPFQDLFDKGQSNTHRYQPIQPNQAASVIGGAIASGIGRLSQVVASAIDSALQSPKYGKDPEDDTFLADLQAYDRPVTPEQIAATYGISVNRAKYHLNKWLGRGYLIKSQTHPASYIPLSSDQLVKSQEAKASASRRGWASHLIVYTATNAGLGALDLVTGGGINWSLFVMGGWGIGMVSHTAEMLNTSRVTRAMKKIGKRLTLPVLRAFKKVYSEISSWYSHVAAYVGVNGFLAGINIGTSPEFMWWLFPAGAWGVGLLGHGIAYLSGKRARETAIEDALLKSKKAKQYIQPQAYGQPWDQYVQDALRSITSMSQYLAASQTSGSPDELGNLDEVLDRYYNTVIGLAQQGSSTDALLGQFKIEQLVQELSNVKSRVEAEPNARLAQSHLDRAILLESQIETLRKLKNRNETVMTKLRNAITSLQTLNLQLTHSKLLDEEQKLNELISLRSRELDDYRLFMGEALQEVEELLHPDPNK